MMSEGCQNVVESLQDDEMPHYLVINAYRDFASREQLAPDTLRELLTELLTSGEVQIGWPKDPSEPPVTDPLKGPPMFIAWRGSVSDRVERAIQLVAQSKGLERDYAYWLILGKYVSRFEDDPARS